MTCTSGVPIRYLSILRSCNKFCFRLCEAQRKHLVSGDPPQGNILSAATRRLSILRNFKRIWFPFVGCAVKREYFCSGDSPLQVIPSILQSVPKPLQSIPHALQAVPNPLQSTGECVMINLSIGNNYMKRWDT